MREPFLFLVLLLFLLAMPGCVEVASISATGSYQTSDGRTFSQGVRVELREGYRK